jgi:hypothetical protein
MATTGERNVTATRHRRPIGISVLMWLGVVQGLLLLASGVLVIAVRDEPEVAAALETTADGVLGVGIVIAVFGLARLALAVALGRGSELVRSLFGAVATVQTGVAVYSLVALRDLRVASAWPLVLAVVELWLLYGSDRAQEFFRR